MHRCWSWTVLALVLAACATTTLTNQWKNPEYSGPPLRKVLVLGVTKQPSVRRVFEDEFAARLQAAGVQAVQSYTLLPQDGQADQAVLEKIVQDIGADGVLVTRLVKQEQKTRVSPGFYYPYPYAGFYGWYSSYWMGYYEPSVYSYDVATAETSLYSPPQSRLVWSGTTETFAPSDVKKDTSEFAAVVIKALREQGII
jgi:hypothetical protein